jgi:hypothetical protein
MHQWNFSLSFADAAPNGNGVACSTVRVVPEMTPRYTIYTEGDDRPETHPCSGGRLTSCHRRRRPSIFHECLRSNSRDQLAAEAGNTHLRRRILNELSDASMSVDRRAELRHLQRIYTGESTDLQQKNWTRKRVHDQLARSFTVTHARKTISGYEGISFRTMQACLSGSTSSAEFVQVSSFHHGT